uniref:tRNA-guanine(15) transglycosylase-like domain-containing protein n=1 Tax=Acrobeloides nanus TaxID=290746 RepID=A0A914DQY7_9BILA
MVYTRIGHIPHLTWDVAQKFLKFSQEPILQFTLPLSFDDLPSVEQFGQGISRFSGTPTKFPIHLSLVDPLGSLESGYNNNKSMAIWGLGGRRSITPENLRDILSTCMPHSFSTLIDYDTPKDCHNKRITKSVFRTTSWNDSTFNANESLKESAILGLCGGFSTFHRIQLAKTFSEKSYASGFSLDLLSFSNNKKIKFAQEFDEIEVSKLISPVISELPESKLRMVEGSFTPMAEEKKAFRIADDFPKSLDFTIIDLNDSRYADDFTPIFEECKCYACSNYTKGYLQHLTNTKEMLLYILLVIHNLTEFDRMFQLIRNYLLECKNN